MQDTIERQRLDLRHVKNVMRIPRLTEVYRRALEQVDDEVVLDEYKKEQMLPQPYETKEAFLQTAISSAVRL